MSSNIHACTRCGKYREVHESRTVGQTILCQECAYEPPTWPGRNADVNYEPSPVHVRQIMNVLNESPLLTTHLDQHKKRFIARLFLYAIADGTLAEAARYALGHVRQDCLECGGSGLIESGATYGGHSEIQAAATVVAHRILGNFVENFELTGRNKMPEASERAFDAIAVEMRAAIPPRPDYTPFAAAFAVLIADGAS